MIEAQRLPIFNKPGSFPPELRASVINKAIQEGQLCPWCGQPFRQCEERNIRVHHKAFREWGLRLNIPLHILTSEHNAMALHNHCHDSLHNVYDIVPPYEVEGWGDFNIRGVFNIFAFPYLDFLTRQLRFAIREQERQYILELVQPEVRDAVLQKV